MKKIFSTIVLVLIVATPAKSEFAILGFGKEIDTLFKSTREYCEKHPSDNIFDAVTRLLSQIRN